MGNYEVVPEHFRYIKLVGKDDYIDTKKLVKHQECYLIFENKLISESIDGTRHILGEIEDARFAI